MSKYKKAQKNNNPIYYFTSCGCKLHEHDIKRHYNRKVCIHHGGCITKRTRKCLDCEKEIDIGKAGPGKNRCDEHTKLHIQKLQLKANHKYYGKIKKTNSKKRAVNKVKADKIKADIEAKKKAKKAKKIVKPTIKKHKPIVPFKGSYHWRGDYCTGIIACNQAGPLKCDKCTKFVGVFFGHDPRKLGLLS